MTPALLISVQPAQLGSRALYRADRLPLVGDVALQHQYGAALPGDAGGEGFQPVAPPRRHCHRRALRGQRSRGGRADPARRPRHQRNRALQDRLHTTHHPRL
jgi:hypothetical protein